MLRLSVDHWDEYKPTTERRGPIEEESATRKEEEGSTKKAPIRSSRARVLETCLFAKSSYQTKGVEVCDIVVRVRDSVQTATKVQCYLTKENQYPCRRALITEGISWKLH
uniref:(northern house mosquito) hypothetical protein n=1 Tax=Culex pipiens TaxID=7175 RepID=A0A8D8B0W9_CULPI